ncbi:DUF5706 domain-containing protein [Methylovorus menthalis]|uniref:Pycsar system effector family protein n=1 Tax=Methylovorus menthalis TaxID=1002227 RepID=UPI001E60F94E|nr:Pycsar system effector family protein [Methylovorus menthalis]MCB4811712.1 DUF5706 domain-containing protein [Methylovorus menthalis]
MENSKKLEFAKWTLERNLAWIAAAEIKVGYIVAINTALISALASIYTNDSSNHGAWAILFVSIAIFIHLLSIIYSSVAVLPKTDGPESNIFFGKISNISRATYENKMANITDDMLITDCIHQIHRNSEISRDKFKAVRISMALGFLALPFWVASILAMMV